jgi:predicted nuclease of predicted toxin-antitoxin system
MKVLIDECAPKALKYSLSAHGHESLTVQEAGWSGKQNGELLTLAETHFDVLITLDTNLRYQQNLAARRISIVVIRSRSNRLDDLRTHFLLACRRLRPLNLGTSST